MFAWLTLAAQIQPLLAVRRSGRQPDRLHPAVLAGRSGGPALHPAGLLARRRSRRCCSARCRLTPGPLAMSSITEHVGWQDAREFMMPPLLNSMKASRRRRAGRPVADPRDGPVRSPARRSISAVRLHLAALHARGRDVHPQRLDLRGRPAVVLSPGRPHRCRIRSRPTWPAFCTWLGGALFTLLVFVCRSSIPGFSLHPAGFLVAATYGRCIRDVVFALPGLAVEGSRLSATGGCGATGWHFRSSWVWCWGTA